VETAKANAALNRINQYTPQGTSTYSLANGPQTKWDEQAYLAANPDAVANLKSNGGGFATGLDHYKAAAAAGGGVRNGVSSTFDPNAQEQWTQTTTYSPEQQRLYDLSTQAQTVYGEAGLAQLGKLREQMATPFALQGAPEWSDRSGQVQTSVGPNDFSSDRAAVEAALYGRLDPSLNQQRTGLETRLRSQGLAPGSEAWTNAMRMQSQSENDARLAVTGQGLQEQQGLFGMALSRGNFNNAGVAQQQNMTAAQRQQMLAEQLAIRNQPLNETSALLTGSQVQSPQFSNAPQVQMANTDTQSGYNTQYQGQMQGYQGQVATNNANTGAAAGAVGAAASAAIIIA
jgi:hypothetical protein